MKITASGSKSSFAANIIDNTITTSGGEGIYVAGGTVTVTIQENDVESNFLHGIAILSESNATIGGTAAGAGNVIAGNGVYGIDLEERRWPCRPAT